MSRSLLVASRAAQSLVLTVGATVAIGETSERYDGSRQDLYATQQLTERRRRLHELRNDTSAEQQQEQLTNAHWIQRETPKFPYIVALSPADNPAVVTQAILGSSDHIIGSPAASTEATLASLLVPMSPVDALVRVVAGRWTALKRQLHGDVPTALLDPQRSALRHQLQALHTALERSAPPPAATATDSEQDGDHEREDDKLVFLLRDFDLWDDDDVSMTLWLQWIHDVTRSGLVHVVVPTTQTVTPATIRKWQQRHRGSPSMASTDSETVNSGGDEFVAILLRVATGSSDVSSAHDKLRVLSQLHALELLGLDSSSSSSPQDEELQEREAEEDATVLPTETQVIVETVGNWWSDLARVCEELSARGLREIESREERLVLVQSVCDALERETADHLLQSLAIQETFSEDEREQRISALQAWKCLEVVTRVGDNAAILASPQTLLQNKQHDATPLNCASAVDALMPFNQRPHGEATFMELLDKRVLFLRPKSDDVAIGVVPCDAKDLVAPCWVETTPLITRAFEKLWRDDFHYLRVLELERFEDNHKLSEEIALFEQEIQEKRREMEKKTRDFILLQRVMKKSDVATRKAELALLELEIQSKQAYLERLRELLD